jgi:hypothetical protein
MKQILYQKKKDIITLGMKNALIKKEKKFGDG